MSSIVFDSSILGHIYCFLSTDDLLRIMMNPINRVTSYIILEILKSRIVEFQNGFTFVYITKVNYGYYMFPTNKNYSLFVNWIGKRKPSDELEPKLVGILYNRVIYL